MTPKQLTLTFAGGAGSVTGANFLLTDPETGTRILIDCGLEQGSDEAEAHNWEPFSYNPKEIDVLVVTHAHIDHIGRIPKLVHDGFRGRIISTPPTRAIAELMLADTAHIVTSEHPDNDELHEMYSQQTRRTMFTLWETAAYDEDISLPDGFSVVLKNAGHILGSAVAQVRYGDNSIAFTGDLGNSPSPILPPADAIDQATYVVTESVYGDRTHEHVDTRRKKFAQALKDNYAAGGILLIPVFSLERTQELLYELDSLVEEGDVPQVPVYLDSPLAIKLTRVYKEFPEYFNAAAQKQLAAGDDIFSFPELSFTETSEESKRIRHTDNPKVIMAGAGMSTGGRIVFHERDFLENPRNTLLFVGYQTAGTLGRKIQEGVSPVEILGQEVSVRAQTETIHGYSGHKDTDALVAYLGGISAVEQVFCAMGEPKSAQFLAQRLRDECGVHARVPRLGEDVTLSF